MNIKTIINQKVETTNYLPTKLENGTSKNIDDRIKGSQRSFADSLITNSVCHFQDYDYSLRNGVYFLTLHLGNISNVTNIAKVIYLKITRILANKIGLKCFWNSSNRPGIILCGDVEGTRNGNVQNSYQYPHIHAVIILPKSIITAIKSSKIIELIKTATQKIKEVKKSYVENCQSKNYESDLAYLVNYTIKAHFKTTLQTKNSECFCPMVYPYDLDIKNSSGKKIRIKRKAEAIQEGVRFTLANMECHDPILTRQKWHPQKPTNYEGRDILHYAPGQACGELWDGIKTRYLGKRKKAI